MNRREFIQKSSDAGLAFAAVSLSPLSQVVGANNQVRIAVIGCGGKGSQHIKVFRQIPDVKIAAICDADSMVVEREKAKFEQDNEKVDTYTDLRWVLDRKDIDAVVIATPNHWHSLAGIWACQAGKDVYVEKPVSHNIWEGRQLVTAAKKYKRIAQAGTQNRSDVGLREFMQYKKDNDLGKIEWVYGLWYKRRNSIGKVSGAQKVPANIDYNLWCGPADMTPLMRQNLHYDWHWFWQTGNGDMANIGVHQIDDCRFLAELNGSPDRVISCGERWGYVDDGQTPNTQLAIFEYGDLPLYIEVRGLPISTKVNSMDNYRGVRMGNVIKFESGYFVGGRGGGWFRDNDFNKVKQFAGDGGGTHQQNFIDAVRSRKSKNLHSPVEECHYSSVLCHMANNSYHVGQHTDIANVKAAVEKYPQGLEQIVDWERHLKANNVNLEKAPVKLGAALEFDKKNEKFTGEWSAEANMLLARNYREPFVVPEKV